MGDQSTAIHDNEYEEQRKQDESKEVVDDWDLPLDFHMFAQHESHPVYLDESNHFFVQCVEELTPLDMLQLSGGEHDATGHCVWTGAFFLLRCLGEGGLEQDCFANKHVLELGCGTGIAGLGLMHYRSKEVPNDNDEEHSSFHKSSPSFLCMTDADPDALALCRRNCRLNKSTIPEGRFPSIQSLCWGTTTATTDCNSANDLMEGSFDCVFAADVLYDIGMLSPILQTTVAFLKRNNGAKFVLSHVPRACFNSVNPPPVDTHLEDYIEQKAWEVAHLKLVKKVRPSDVSSGNIAIPDCALNIVSLEELQEIGAVIFVFRTGPW